MRWIWVVFVVLFFSCQSALKFKAGENIRTSQSIQSDSAAHAFLIPWRDSLQKFTHKPLGYADTTFSNSERTGNLGNLTADLVLKIAQQMAKDSGFMQPQCAVLNTGGLRNSLPGDTIRWEDVFNLMPFENEIVLLRLSGIEMDSLLNKIAQNKGEAVAGIYMETKGPQWTKAQIQQMSFDSRRDYWIVTNDYMAGGGDNFSMLTHPLQRTELQIKLRDAIAEGIQNETRMHGKLLHRNTTRIVIHE